MRRILPTLSGRSGAAGRRVDPDVIGLLAVLAVLMVLLGFTSDRFLTLATFNSIAFQLPELGLLTLAMLIPILSGGLNLAITFTANISALVLAGILQAGGGPDASVAVFALGVVAALATGAASGWVMGWSSPIPARIRSWCRCR